MSGYKIKEEDVFKSTAGITRVPSASSPCLLSTSKTYLALCIDGPNERVPYEGGEAIHAGGPLETGQRAYHGKRAGRRGTPPGGNRRRCALSAVVGVCVGSSRPATRESGASTPGDRVAKDHQTTKHTKAQAMPRCTSRQKTGVNSA
jgi:hypothetical protein